MPSPAPVVDEDDGFKEIDPKKKYTQSQLMRLALMRLHERRGGSADTFALFYIAEMKRIISVIDKKN